MKNNQLEMNLIYQKNQEAEDEDEIVTTEMQLEIETLEEELDDVKSRS